VRSECAAISKAASEADAKAAAEAGIAAATLADVRADRFRPSMYFREPARS
jgi:hypothetical protein